MRFSHIRVSKIPATQHPPITRDSVQEFSQVGNGGKHRLRLLKSSSLRDVLEMFPFLKAAGSIPEPCVLRQVKYLNRLIEQDYWFMKRLTKPGMGFFSDLTAWRTFQGFEVMNMICKGQVQGVLKGDVGGQVTLVTTLFGIAA